MNICKNCGHSIAQLDGNWYHLSGKDDKDGIVLSKRCYYVLENEEAKQFETTEMQQIADKIKKKFGDYELDYWFFELGCHCSNPEVGE